MAGPPEAAKESRSAETASPLRRQEAVSGESTLPNSGPGSVQAGPICQLEAAYLAT